MTSAGGNESSSQWASPSGSPEDAPDRRTSGAAPTYGQQPAGQPAPQYGQPAPQYGQYGHPAPQFGQPGPPPPQEPGQPGPAGYPPAPAPQYAGQAPAYLNPGLAPYGFEPKPGVIPLRPLTLSDIFDGAFRTVRGNPGATVGLALVVCLIVAVPVALLAVAAANTTFGSTDAQTGARGSVSAGFLISSYGGNVVSIASSIVLTGMLTVVISDAVLGRRMTISEAWTRAKGRLLPLLGLTLLLSAAGLLVLGIVVALAVGIGVATNAAVGVLIGILLGIPVFLAIVYVGIRLSLASPALVLEQCGIRTALRRSWTLSAGQFWRILGISVLGQLAAGLIAGIVASPLTMIGMFMSMPDPQTPTGTQLIVGLLLMQLGSVVSQAVTTPFVANITALLYVDQRIRREALDVTLMAAARA